MPSKISATFEIKGWDEQPFDESVGVSKLTRASVAKEYAGDVEGTSATEWLMAYHPDKSAAFVGLERVKGTVDGIEPPIWEPPTSAPEAGADAVGS